MIKFIIHGRLESMNQYINSCCRSPYEKNNMKKRSQSVIMAAIARDIPDYKATTPIRIRYRFVETSFRRDLDNIATDIRLSIRKNGW